MKHMPPPVPQRIVLTVAAYFPDSYGGAERQARILATALGEKGIDVTLLAPTVASNAPLEEETSFGRIWRRRLKAYPNLGGRNFPSFLAWTAWVPWRLRGSEWRGVPIYTFHARLHALGPAIAAMRQKSPFLIKLGGGGEASEFDALRSKKYVYGHLVERLLRRRVDIFVANSGQIAAELQKLAIPDARIARFPNGVVLPDDATFRAALASRSGRRFVYAARLLPDKNVDALYRAAVSLADAGEVLELRLIGDGPEKERLEGLRGSSPGTESVAFPGFVSDVYGELQAADFFVCASRREGQSNALLEAMSAGVIPIVYNASGVAEVVSHGVNGFIVNDAGPEAFARAMKVALDMPRPTRDAMSIAARTFAEENIGIAAIADRTMATIGAIAAPA